MRNVLRPARPLVLAMVPALLIAGCSSASGGQAAGKGQSAASVTLTLTPLDGEGATAPDLPVTVGAGGGTLAEVVLADAAGNPVAGTYSPARGSWTADDPLGYGTRYTLRASAVDAKGRTASREATFTTLTPARLVGAAEVTPAAGQTVGVGMPITVELDAAVTDPAARAQVEERLKVATTTPVEGAWGWIDDKTVRFRPREYWPAGTRITVSTDLTGARLGTDIYGAPGGPVDMTVGDEILTVVDASTHEMTVTRNGEELRTVPVTTGKPGFTTRAGTKVILAKEQHVLMDGTTVGIPAGTSESYRLDVYWATRVTWSGEYLHAAPWSVASQGVANVSHGCVGMSMENAKWYFNTVKIGDVVKVVNTGSDKTMETEGNGYGEWNLTWDEWLERSAAGSMTSRQI